MQIAIITSQFNSPVTEKLLEEARAKLQILKIKPTEFLVPGALELPFASQMLAREQAYDAIICLGAVIRGETDHYDYVCDHAFAGLMRVSLDENIPVINGILTVQNKEHAFARVSKGADFAEAAVTMLNFNRTS